MSIYLAEDPKYPPLLKAWRVKCDVCGRFCSTKPLPQPYGGGGMLLGGSFPIYRCSRGHLVW